MSKGTRFDTTNALQIGGQIIVKTYQSLFCGGENQGGWTGARSVPLRGTTISAASAG